MNTLTCERVAYREVAVAVVHNMFTDLLEGNLHKTSVVCMPWPHWLAQWS